MGTIVNSRLDYANALYLGLPKYQISRLQVVQNTAARLVTGKKKWESISPSLRTLHWLPVKDRIAFKALCLTHKCIHGKAPQYLCDKIEPHNSNRVLRSTDQNLVRVPKTKYKSKGERRFAFQGPRLWNALPTSIRLEENHLTFRRQIKTLLFWCHETRTTSAQKRFSSHAPRFISFSFIHSWGLHTVGIFDRRLKSNFSFWKFRSCVCGIRLYCSCQLGCMAPHDLCLNECCFTASCLQVQLKMFLFAFLQRYFIYSRFCLFCFEIPRSVL